ncbi:hypothetical protein BSLA_03f0298 [Burkholderia stabilis]|nr:hypothetical protein BSLA_03f0298 [Burkholderia stabilis]
MRTLTGNVCGASFASQHDGALMTEGLMSNFGEFQSICWHETM